MAKNMAKTARRQLRGRYLLFGEYLRKLSKMNLTSLIDAGEHVLAMFLNKELFLMNNKAINAFSFRKI